MSTSLEIEAKLRAPSAASLRRIERQRGLGPYRLRKLSVDRLRTIYLDTEDGLLARAEVALRVRRAGSLVEATVKAGGKVRGTVHERSEWNVPLDRIPRFPWRRLPERLRKRLPESARNGSFQPTLETRIRRTALSVLRPSGGGAIAEIALDEVHYCLPGGGLIGAGGWEVEIELLRKGTRRDLATLVQALCKDHPLRPSRLSKLERGRRWAAGQRPR